MSLFDILKYLPYGVTNRTDATFFDNKSNNDFIRNTPLSVLRQNVKDRVTPNVLSRNNEFVAVCLRVLPKESSIFNFYSPTARINTLLGAEQSSNQLKIVARIPEIDAAMPAPENENDIGAIMNHSVFIGDESMDEPAVGSLIRVTFQDVNNFQGGIYLGPYFVGNAAQALEAVSQATSAVNNQIQEAEQNQESAAPPQQSQEYQPPPSTQSNQNIIGRPTIFPRDKPASFDFTKIDPNLYQRSRDRGITVNTFVRPESVTTDIHKNLYICAAVAEIIEQYWRQVYADAKVFVSASHRPNDPDDPNHNHIEAAAIDFSITYGSGKIIPVFQSWGTLFMLIKARRIPFGGCGIYINLNADGVKGISPEQAGNRSGSKPKTPPGGSAHTHYDFRAWLGFVGKSPNKNAANKPSVWLGIDELGSGGKDDWYYFGNPELTKTKSLPAGSITLTKQSLNQRVPGCTTYFANFLKLAQGDYNASLGDPNLPEVSTSVLNILQVLGFES